MQGDRAGICVTQLDPKLIERCIVCTPRTVPTFSAAIAAVERVRFYSGKLPSSSKVRSPHQVCLPVHVYQRLASTSANAHGSVICLHAQQGPEVQT